MMTTATLILLEIILQSLRQSLIDGETATLKAFRTWVRKTVNN